MATQFLFNPSQVQGVARNLSQKSKQLEAAKADLKKTVNKVSSWWEGESETAYIKQYEKFEPSVAQLSELALAISKQLDDIVALKKKNESARAKMFK